MALTQFPPTLKALPVEPLGEMSVTFREVQIFGTEVGTRMTAVAEGGQFRGPRVRAEVLPGSADWIVVGNDGIARLDVRATLRTDEGHHIFMTSPGRCRLTDDARVRFLAGESVAGDDLFARTSPVFETNADDYRWLNSVVAIGVVTRLSLTQITYQVYGLEP